MTSEGAPTPSLRWWDITTALLLVVLSVLGVFEAHAEPTLWVGAESQPLELRLVIIAAPLVALGILYLLLGRRALRRGLLDLPQDAASKWFLALELTALFAATFFVPIYAVWQAIAHPMVWVIAVRYRHAVLWCAGVALAAGGGVFTGMVGSNPTAALASAIPTFVFSFVFSLAMGTWITRIAEQGERHKALAEELRASQNKVAELSAAAGATAERERISRELHDTLTQSLTGLVMLSEQAERALQAADLPRTKERLGRVASAAREAVIEARALVATSQPLGDGGLIAAIERVAMRMAEDTGMLVDCHLEQIDMARERQVVLLRAAQEGLANARKHSHAKRVVVTLSRDDGGWAVLLVEDDGQGPESNAENSGGFGLSGLTDRAKLAGGSVEFGQRAQGGARLEVRLPVEGVDSQ